MQKNNRAFTLIELLVVILIIGILAAVALPQYQKAVAKARATEIINYISTGQKAIDLYVLAHGYQDADFMGTNTSDLDISIPVSADLQERYVATAVCDGISQYCDLNLTANGNKGGLVDIELRKTVTGWAGQCVADNTLALSVCRLITDHQAHITCQFVGSSGLQGCN